MVNSSNDNSNSLKKEYCQKNSRPEWCTKTSNSNTSENDIINQQIEALRLRNQKVDKKVKDAAKQVSNASKDLASVIRQETPQSQPNTATTGTSVQPAASAPAAGGARKSRKHKRTRKHMRKHTRKHKVMKSKMTKSKSKKVMQKGGKYGAHGLNMNEFRKKRQEATRKSLDKVRGLRVATHVIAKMKNKEKKNKGH